MALIEQVKWNVPIYNYIRDKFRKVTKNRYVIPKHNVRM